MEKSPTRFGCYELVGELGDGTTGTVYEARDTRLTRRVAIKVPDLSPEGEGPMKAARFQLECQAVAWLTSWPGCSIPRLLEVNEDPPGHRYYVRELINGCTFEQRVAEESIDLRAGLSIIAQVADAVQRIHVYGFAHRNLSPTNVLVGRDGLIWLIGFGRVGFLAGSQMLPAGTVGTPTEVDVQGLRELLKWLCDALAYPVPDSLVRSTTADQDRTAGAFGDAVTCYLRGGPGEVLRGRSPENGRRWWRFWK